jgi:hypothetical protein
MSIKYKPYIDFRRVACKSFEQNPSDLGLGLNRSGYPLTLTGNRVDMIPHGAEYHIKYISHQGRVHWHARLINLHGVFTERRIT